MRMICLALGFFLLCVSSGYPDDMATGDHLVGGRCEYKTYEGHAEIISITKKTEPNRYSKERYEVKFSFTPKREINEKYAKTEGREFLLLLNDSSYPGPKFLKKYDLQVGKVFRCDLQVIIKGTCSPLVFKIPDISLDDYFEN
jgi:hypothetical protein